MSGKIEFWYPVIKNKDVVFLRYPDQMPGFGVAPDGWTAEDVKRFWAVHELAGKVELVDIVGFREKCNLEFSKVDIQPFKTANGEAAIVLEVRKHA